MTTLLERYDIEVFENPIEELLVLLLIERNFLIGCEMVADRRKDAGPCDSCFDIAELVRECIGSVHEGAEQ